MSSQKKNTGSAKHSAVMGAWNSLGNYIDSRRESLGISSRRELARQLKIDPAYLTKVVHGNLVPNAETCNKISEFFEDPPEIALRLAGWLKEISLEDIIKDDVDPAEMEKFILEFAVAIKDDPDLQALYKLYRKQKDPAKRRSFVKEMKHILGQEI